MEGDPFFDEVMIHARIVHLNCSVQFRKHCQPIKLSNKRGKSQRGYEELHIYLRQDAMPVVNTARICLIAIRPW